MTIDKKILLKGLAIGFGIVGVIGIVAYIIINKKDDSQSEEQDDNGGRASGGRSIIIGDSQTEYIAKQTKKVKMLGSVGSEQNLWQGGKGLSWLKNAVSKYPITTDVSNVVINIGTNGGFNLNENVKGLVSEIRRVFPNAKLFVVQGSWGWGGNAKKTETDVRNYYKKYADEGVVVIEPPIGAIEPHGDKPVYKLIGANLDKAIK